MLPAIQYAPEFDAATHCYRWQGQRKLSVTQVLDISGNKCQFFKGDHRDRGTAIHYTTELIDRDELDLDTMREYDAELPPEKRIMGYLTAYYRFRDESKPEVIYSESALYAPSIDVCGTMDRAVKIGEHYGILDLKTGSLPAETSIQTAGYAYLLFDKVPTYEIRRWALQLKKDGKYRLRLYDDMEDYQRWLAAVRKAQEIWDRQVKQ